MKLRGKRSDEKVQLQMTSMIDIVFLLLIFFVMTFRIAEQEGDFNIRMPLDSTAAAPTDNLDLPLKLRLLASPEGNLSSIRLNDTDYGVDFARLQGQIVTLVQAGAGATDDGPELEIDADYNLRYEHVVSAITASSGYKSGDQIVKLIQKIKFSPPRK